MRSAPALLVGSLATNAALCTVLLVWAHTVSPPATVTALSLAAKDDEARRRVEAERVTWASLAQGGDQELLARLKAEGFPSEVLRVIASSRLDERFAARRKALAAKSGPRPYWRSSSGGYPPFGPEDARLRTERRALDKEYAEAMEQLVGAYYPEYERARHQRDYGDLPSEKVRAIEAINRDYGELKGRIREAIKGVTFPEDRAQLEYLEKERRDDLARVLTPAELEAYNLRASETAGNLRNQLSLFDPSEEEYRAIFKVQQAFDQQSANAALTGDESRRLREAQIKAVLSPERFADYQVKTAGSYRQMRDLVASLKLPTEAIAQVIGVQHDITLRADNVRNDATLTSEQRNAQLAALSQEATTKLTSTLGQQGFEYYQYIGRDWLAGLRSKAPAPKKN